MDHIHNKCEWKAIFLLLFVFVLLIFWFEYVYFREKYSCCIFEKKRRRDFIPKSEMLLENVVRKWKCLGKCLVKKSTKTITAGHNKFCWIFTYLGRTFQKRFSLTVHLYCSGVSTGPKQSFFSVVYKRWKERVNNWWRYEKEVEWY